MKTNCLSQCIVVTVVAVVLLLTKFFDAKPLQSELVRGVRTFVASARLKLAAILVPESRDVLATPRASAGVRASTVAAADKFTLVVSPLHVVLDLAAATTALKEVLTAEGALELALRGRI